MTVEIGVLISIGAIVFSVGAGFAVLRGFLRKLVDAINLLATKLERQISVTEDVNRTQTETVRLLASIDLKHTPEHADHAGFGTIAIGKQVGEILHRLELMERDYRSDREIHVSAHDKIVELLKIMSEGS